MRFCLNAPALTVPAIAEGGWGKPGDERTLGACRQNAGVEASITVLCRRCVEDT